MYTQKCRVNRNAGKNVGNLAIVGIVILVLFTTIGDTIVYIFGFNQ